MTVARMVSVCSLKTPKHLADWELGKWYLATWHFGGVWKYLL